jgi:hypothetical protein
LKLELVNLIFATNFESQSTFKYLIITNYNVMNIISWAFGFLVFIIGVINTFWGNDPGAGVCIALLAFIYFPPITTLIKERTGFQIPMIAKIGLGLLIIIAALGVGELFDKIDLMMMDL